MISFSRLLVAAIAGIACSSMLTACSSDDGKPSTGTGSGTPVGAPPSAPTGTAAGSSTTAPPPAPGTKKALLEGCVTDEDCASGVCYVGDQGSYCSLKCTAETAATVCVAPMAGTCNKKGFCKKP